MAIPNTTFVSGAILTASQQNNLAWGQVAYQENTTAQFPIAAEVITITSPTFTAVANRRYLVTYYEPALANNSAGSPVNTMGIRLTNLTGTTLAYSDSSVLSTTGRVSNNLSRVITTFTPGSTVVVATLSSPGNVAIANRNAQQAAYLSVIDIGAA